MMLRPRNRTGFSVIEVLIALLIIGLVMSSIYGALVVTLEAKKASEAEISDVKQSALVFETLERDLRHACVPRGDMVLFKCEDGSLAQGSGGKVNFVASIWSSFPEEEEKEGDRDEDLKRPRSPICEVGYFLKPDPENRELFVLYRREDFFLDSDFEKGGIYLKLASGIRELTLRFLAEATEDDPEPEPEESWDGEDWGSLPAAVQIRLVFAPKNVEDSYGPEDEKEKVFEATVPLIAGGSLDDEPLPAGEGEEEGE